jgi:RimJ/RimL family protein N-acetyltransferase
VSSATSPDQRPQISHPSPEHPLPIQTDRLTLIPGTQKLLTAELTGRDALAATLGVVRRAFEAPSVRRVIAGTLPELTPSIGVLRKCGFTLIGEGSEPGVIRYEMNRSVNDLV